MAAFYSDVEHEVLEVTAGHRITLTYLYLAPGTGLLAGRLLSLQASQLPLTRHFQHAHTNLKSMPGRGYLGFMLAHSHPHPNHKLNHFVPSMLKGSAAQKGSRLRWPIGTKFYRASSKHLVL